MTQILFLSIGLYILAAFMPLILAGLPKIARQCTALTTIVATGISLIPAISVIVLNNPVEICFPWNLPLGSFHLKIDLLSAWFIIPLAIVSILSCIYGLGYRKNDKKGLDGYGSFLSILIGGMFMVVIAWDGVLFLLVWELMSFAAFFLVMYDHQIASVRKAGWIYLAATHLGTAFLFVLFVLWAQKAGSFDFSQMATVKEGLGTLYILALLGFGAKAGFFGLHVWLPEAHPAAPSSVSGLMSGIMIKMGIYGIFRFLYLANNWDIWWGVLILAIGVLSGLGGVILALIQSDIKRMLAYCSVENIGIICLGIGLGIIGVTYNQPAALWGFAGALFHVLNHALFKTGLFMGAGSVVHATHTRLIDKLGGLQSKMPFTAVTFLLFSAAICGLPPFNGFASELFIYMSSLKTLTSQSVFGLPALMSFIAVAALALIGGFALFGFIKIFGVTFLGQPRSDLPEPAKDPVTLMKVPMGILAVLCIALGLGAYFPATLALKTAMFLPSAHYYSTINLVPPSLFWIIPLVSVALLLLIGSTVLLKNYLQKKRTITKGPLWRCGYNQATARMQYSGASFSGEISQNPLTPDPCMKYFFIPVFCFVDNLFSRVRKIQHGQISLYILYIILALVAVITWSCLW
jgi:formate hydrogenlyase subunit 3/multisubunit Na+/H+ antiporter MnhD subunit